MPDHDRDNPPGLVTNLDPSNSFAMGLWPTSAIEGAFDKIDELYAIIDRAAERLADVDCPKLAVRLGSIRDEGFDLDALADRLVLALNAILDARAILAEADRAELESEGDSAVGEGLE